MATMYVIVAFKISANMMHAFEMIVDKLTTLV